MSQRRGLKKFLNVRDTSEMTDSERMLTAAVRGRDRIVKLLLKRPHVDPSYQDKDGLSALHFYSQKYNMDLIRRLLDRKAKVNQKARLGVVPLHLACQTGQNDAVQLLLKAGAKRFARDNMSRNSLHYAALAGSVEVTQTLLKMGLKLSSRDSNGWTPLHLAAKNGRFELTSWILESGGSPVDVFDFRKRTPLHHALMLRETAVAMVLLKHGANPEAVDEEGWTPLHYAVEHCPDVVEPLLERGVSVDARTMEQETPLHRATQVATVERLIKYGADPNALAHNGQTPLHRALMCSCCWSSAVVPHLIQAGADISLPDNSGKTGLDLLLLTCWCRRRHPACQREVVLRQANLLRAAGLAFLDRPPSQLKHNSDPSFYRRCMREVEIMKQTRLQEHITVQNVLLEPMSRLLSYLRHPDLQITLSSGTRFDRRFPIYSTMLKRKIKQAMAKMELLESGEIFFLNMPEHLPRLPYDCIEVILGYLTDKDLKSLPVSKSQ